MAKEKEQEQTIDPMAVVSQALAMLQSQIPEKQIAENSPEYRRHLEKEGFFDEFERPVYQNGFAAQARGLSADVRHRASNLKSGKYLNGRVRVEASEKEVHLHYPNKRDDLINNQMHWRDFSDLIDKVWNEMHSVTA